MHCPMFQCALSNVGSGQWAVGLVSEQWTVGSDQLAQTLRS